MHIVLLEVLKLDIPMILITDNCWQFMWTCGIDDYLGIGLQLYGIYDIGFNVTFGVLSVYTGGYLQLKSLSQYTPIFVAT